jgi:hypothetical protein
MTVMIVLKWLVMIVLGGLAIFMSQLGEFEAFAILTAASFLPILLDDPLRSGGSQ